MFEKLKAAKMDRFVSDLANEAAKLSMLEDAEDIEEQLTLVHPLQPHPHRHAWRRQEHCWSIAG
jgi:hypothetical protein